MAVVNPAGKKKTTAAQEHGAAHTPGPWRVEGLSVYALQQDGWLKGEPCMVNRFYVHVQGGHAAGMATTATELEANARLIAAAPDLLAALERIVKLEQNTHEVLRWDIVSAVARAAIAKAKGEA